MQRETGLKRTEPEISLTNGDKGKAVLVYAPGKPHRKTYKLPQ